MDITVSWFSAGVSSAVATKLYNGVIDNIIYTHIDDQHPDTFRFIDDCQNWFGKPVEILQSNLKSVDAACRASAYVNGPSGAACTRLLKKRVRKEWEYTHRDDNITYIWGMDASEKHRADRLPETMPEFNHVFPLIDNNISKQEAHRILRASKIKRPKMYDLGFKNNNCIGCVKGGAGYWNKIRQAFPEVFEARSKLERLIGHSCIKGTFLDELDPNAGRKDKLIMDDCGIMCELLSLD